MNVTYLSVVGLLYLSVAAWNALIWKEYDHFYVPHFKPDRHSGSEAVLGAGHVAIDVVIHLPLI
ncbi:MAG: hypothetical protein AAF311_05845 [Pseudomonadota bacterium]